MAWRVAKSLLTLRDQVNALYPNRSKSDDGSIGDERHQASVSDHNPDSHGVVRAMDLTHDPAHGFNSYDFAELLRERRDPRIKYVISNGRIFSSSVAPWQFRPYHGSNKHDRHVHISVVGDARADDTKLWDIDPIRAPLPPPTPTPTPVPVPTPPIVTSDARFGAALKKLLVHEGGNDDDPRDPGGRTSRGITQREYDEWRRTHPGLPHDVWYAPDSTVRDIYRRNYWDAVRADELPAGVDYAVFDYAVNSGISRATKALQEAIGANPDGVIGPITMAAVQSHSPQQIINDIADERLHYLRGLSIWPTFGRGWSTRVADVRRDATSEAVA